MSVAADSKPKRGRGRNRKWADRSAGGGTERKRQKVQRQKNDNTQGVRGDYTPIEKTNAELESYYKTLQIIPESEWEEFMSTMRSDLPATFRVVDSRGDSHALNKVMIEKHFSKLEGVTINDEPAPIPQNIPWYPNGLAWQINMSRPLLRHSEELFCLHQFLVSEAELGNIARQEAVSMIPPLLLGVKPHHCVLDMCAAPGSKTLQLLEALHSDGPHPPGLVIANDGDNKRCYMLVTQTKRFSSLAFMVTNEDATRFPNLKIFNEKKELVNMKYDRILCDVPCTGDGTLRKNYAIWKKWSQGQALGIHKLQRRILLRAMDMLAEGGRIVYSTCSLNPIENEATVLSALKNRPGFRLLPTTECLPGLKRNEGLTNWKVMHSSGVWYEKFEDVDEKHKKSISPTMFPEGAVEHQLQNCIRVYPHAQNTGGFFICILERKADDSVSPTVSDPAPGTSEPVTDECPVDAPATNNFHKNTNTLVDKMKWKNYHGFREDPFIFLQPDQDCFKSIKDFYSLTDDFPYSNMFVRSESETKQRNLSVACSRIRDIIEQNTLKIKVINCGLRLFTYCKENFSSCNYRLLQEGAHFTSSFMGDKIFQVEMEDMIKILGPDSCPKESMDAALYEKIKDLPQGIAVFHLKPEGIVPHIFTCVYVTPNHVKTYITEDEKNHFRVILGLEPLLTKREIKKRDAMEHHRQKRLVTADRIAAEERSVLTEEILDRIKAEKENENQDPQTLQQAYIEKQNMEDEEAS